MRIKPFRALHYSPAAVGDLASVIAPPYDTIDDEQVRKLYRRSPYNVVRLILNTDADRYGAAAADLTAWRKAGVLVRDECPAFYYYVQNFRLPGGRACERSGLMAAVRIEEFAAGGIMPHERTFDRAKHDRLCLIEACRANLSPVFSVYPEQTAVPASLGERAKSEPPWIDVTDDRAERHRVWRVSDAETVNQVDAALSESTLFIADGHHRYETALNYREQCRARGATDPEAPENFILMYLASMEDPGLVVLPTHRVLDKMPETSGGGWRERLEELFFFEAFPRSEEGRAALLDRLNGEKSPGCLGLCARGESVLQLLRMRDVRRLDELLGGFDPSVRYLDTTVLDALVLRRLLGVDCGGAAQEGWLTYTPDAEAALASIDSGGAAVGFIVRPPRIEDVHAACVAGQTMPQKSTYFYPKLLSGLVIRPLWGEED